MSKTIFKAKMIITMDASHPFATHVAVEDGKIKGLGDAEIIQLFPGYELNEVFADKTILPGFIEGHAHALAGQDGLAPYVGFFDRPSPDGNTLVGRKTREEVITYLQEEEKKLQTPDEVLVATGFDPIYFDGPRFSGVDLDKISTARPIMVLHASGHVLTVNSKVIGMIPQDKINNVQGIVKDETGKPTGELQEVGAITLAMSVSPQTFAKFLDPKVLIPRYIKLAKMAGCTTIAEMGLSLNLDDENQVGIILDLYKELPVRIVPMYFVPTSNKKPEEMVSYVKSLEEKNTDKVRFGRVKLISDGSLQAFTGRVRQPYINGTQNGLWNQDPETLKKFVNIFHPAKIQINCHCNGDEASEAFIEAVKEAQAANPWPDNRHTVQHAQLVDEPQFLEMKQLGMCANIFSNHIFYWGDQHRDKILGPERANRMDAANTALSLGVPFSLHCDANVTPISPLFNVWAAVNRTTATGKVLGENEKIPVEDGLYAMTMGAARLLKLDDEIGSITVGKTADFVILAQDPYTVEPQNIKDIQVVTTVSGGVVN